MTKTVVIFGGSGFIGNYIVRRLSKLGYRIIVPTSNLRKSMHLKLLGNVGQVVPIKFNKLDQVQIEEFVRYSDCVINLKTIWTESKNNTFYNKIYKLNKLIVDTVIKYKITKYIFFSGIGTNSKSLSKRISSIDITEKYIKNNLTNYSIIRPSIVIGDGDKFINKLLKFFRLSFFIPIFGNGKARFQPTYVDDVALGIEKLVIKKEVDGNIYEFGGNEILDYNSLYKIIIKEINKKRILIPIPFFLAKFCIFFIEKLPIDLINREQLDLFKTDNLVGNHYLTFKDLNIKVVDTKQIIKKIIKTNYFISTI